MSKDKEMSEEDYLKKHLGDLDNPKNVMNNDIPFVAQPKIDNTRTTDLQFFNFDIKELPCGEFYPSGTVFMVRPAQVREIQAYSMVDDNNFYDIVEKMNDMLQAFVRIKFPDGKIGSYLEIKDQDSLFLIFLIRELTFQQGNALAVTVKCGCGQELKVELVRSNFHFHEMDEKLEKYFNLATRTFQFKTVNGKFFENKDFYLEAIELSHIVPTNGYNITVSNNPLLSKLLIN